MGKIFNIQHFSIHDGPGVRTVVFFKGCNLTCAWCHNPESIQFSQNLLFYEEKCIGCGSCFKNCPKKNHVIDENGTHVILNENCDKCLICAKNCYAEAITSVGENIEAADVFKIILPQKLYFKNGGGGVTFSGGEVMLQIDFLHELLQMCKKENTHTAIDTAGNVPWDFFSKILHLTDLFLYDIKAFDFDIHKKLTGVGNALILKNFEALYEANAEIIVRIPYIKTKNEDELPKIAEYLKNFPHITTEVLPYHSMGTPKYKALGINSEIVDKESEKLLTPTKEETEEMKKIFDY